MPTFNTTATLNGVNPFTINQFGTFQWSDNFLRTVDLWDNDASNIHNITLNLTGSNWQIRDLSIGGAAQQNIVLNDMNANGGRFLELVNLNTAISATLSLQSTSARAIMGFAGTHDFSLGGGWFGHVHLTESQSNTVSNGPGGTIQALVISGPGDTHIVNDLDIGGRAQMVRIWRGNNDIAVTGRIETLRIDEGISNDVAVAAGGRIDYMITNGFYDPVTDSFSARNVNMIDVQGRIDHLRTWAAENTITVGSAGRIRSATLDDSLSTITFASGGYMEELSSSGDTSITLLGSGRIESFRLFRGTQDVTTGTAWTDTYHSYLSTNTLNIGTGGMGNISLSDAIGAQSVTAAGFVNALRLTGDATATMTFNGGIGSVLAFGGTNYTINIGAGTNTGYNGTIQSFASVRSTINTGDGRVASIFTGDGNDVITTGAGFVTGIDAGAGNDRIVLGTGGAGIVAGGDGNDTIIGSANDDVLFGGAGDDSLRGGLGNDSLFGGDGNDLIRGEGGDNLIEGGLGRDTVIGGGGDDVIYGGSGNDRLQGNDGEDFLFGGSGNDTIFGGAGHDLIHGGDGNDSLRGGPGNDTMFGGAGDDIMRSDNGLVEMYGGDGNDSVYGGTNEDTVYGGSGDDLVAGDRGDDLVYGGLGNDRVFGNDGDDLLYGGAGNDTISGGNGNDTIFGGSGTDVLTGGRGADVFVFESVTDSPHGTGRDRITDFRSSEGDLIDLRGLSQELTFVTSFTGVAGQVRYNSTIGRLYVDLTGTGATDFSVDLDGAPSLTAADLIL